MANHGTDFGRRWTLLRERVEAMKCIWTQEAAEYHGKLVNFDPIWQYPKPLQKPHPPIILGSASRRSLSRIVAYCDGWVPIGFAMPDLAGALRELRERATAAGRDPGSIEISLYWAPGDADALRSYADMGIARGILAVPPVGRDEILAMLDQHAPLVDQVRA